MYECFPESKFVELKLVNGQPVTKVERMESEIHGLGISPRVLISRLSAIGDCIHSLPLVSAIRSRFPDAFIGWVTQSSGASLIKDHAGLNEVITVARDWYRSPGSVLGVRQRLRNLMFDVAVDPQSLTKSSALAWLSGAPYRIGFTRGQARETSTWFNNIRIQPTTTHVVERYLELLRPLGIDAPSVDFGLGLAIPAVGMVQRFLSNRDLSRYSVINPGAGWDSKLWPHENYAEVVRHLHEKHALRSVCVWSGDRERAWAERITEMAGEAVVLAPDTTLPELSAFCKRAKLFIGSDTGPMHLSAAHRTPCVAMYGPTRISDCGPYGKEHLPLQAFYQGGTSKQRRGSDNRAMQAISTKSVIAACDTILARDANAKYVDAA